MRLQIDRMATHYRGKLNLASRVGCRNSGVFLPTHPKQSEDFRMELVRKYFIPTLTEGSVWEIVFRSNSRTLPL